ncbi:MAG: sulfatase [Planctomycetota bacterium]|nr:sulfatase [Planctomycetota bacterium]
MTSSNRFPLWWGFLALVFFPAIARATDQRPNILFAIADDWSYGHAGAYGCRWTKTPNFDRVAREGLLFSRAYTPNAKCAPSRACILTGRNSWQLEEACNHVVAFPPKFRSFPEALQKVGYQVGMTGKGWGPGYARNEQGKPRQIAGKRFDRLKARPPASGISNNDYSGNFKEFLKQSGKGTPWCFWYGTTEPHRGYEWQVGIKKGGKKLTDIDQVPPFFPDNETVRTDLLDYAFEVEHFDLHLGRILQAIEDAGQMENTIVVVTADHGMPFPRCKGQAYDYSNHVPLAICWPAGIRGPGRKIDDYVSFVDLAPTFIEASGISWEKSGMKPTPGQSLFDIFRSNLSGQVNPRRDHVLIGKERHDIGRPDDAGYPIRGIVKNNRLYIRNYQVDRWPAGDPLTGYLNCDGGPTKTEILNRRRLKGSDPYWDVCFGKREPVEFFDLQQDPACMVNLVDQPTSRSDRLAMEKQMIRELLQQNDRRMIGKGDYFEKIPYVNRDANFYNRFIKGEKLNAGWVNRSDFEKENPADPPR